jgi:hypothetical protein
MFIVFFEDSVYRRLWINNSNNKKLTNKIELRKEYYLLRRIRTLNNKNLYRV